MGVYGAGNDLTYPPDVVYCRGNLFLEIDMKAFTLTELIVVMAVMLILLSITVPLYRQAANFTLDVVPEALRCTHSMARQGGYAVMLIRHDEIGTFAICMKADGIPLTASIDLNTKRISIPEYEPAIVVYDSRGHLRTGMRVIIDGDEYVGTNRLTLAGTTSWLHRSSGDIIR